MTQMQCMCYSIYKIPLLISGEDRDLRNSDTMRGEPGLQSMSGGSIYDNVPIGKMLICHNTRG